MQFAIFSTMKFWTHIHVSQRMNPINFVDHLTFHLVPTAGQSIHSSGEIPSTTMMKLSMKFYTDTPIGVIK